jgi:potassium channel subfamily K
VIQGIKNESEDHEVSNYDRQAILVQQLLSRMIKLEAQAREMLLEHLDRGLARTLLVADRNGKHFSLS